jgi:hypothetical protein
VICVNRQNLENVTVVPEVYLVCFSECVFLTCYIRNYVFNSCVVNNLSRKVACVECENICLFMCLVCT